MGTTWLRLALLGGLCSVTLFLTALTPDTKVPVIEHSDEFDYAEAVETLEAATVTLDRFPETEIQTLQAEHRLVVDIEGREPSGVAWSGLAVAIGLLGILAITRSGNRFGHCLVALAWAAAVLGLARAVADLSVHQPNAAIPGRQVALAIADTGWIPLGVVLGPLLILTFPTGRLVSRRWRWVVGLSVIAAVLLFFQLVASPLRFDGRALAPEWTWNPRLGEPLLLLGLYLWMATVLMSASSFFVRIKRASSEERPQLRWVSFGLAMAVILGITSDLAQRFGGDQRFWGPVMAVGFLVVLPLTALAAIFRFRLFDIDVVIRKSIVHLAVTLGVALVYVGFLATVGRLSAASELVPSTIAVLAAAITFEPGRLRITEAVDHAVYRRKARPYRSLAALSAKLGSFYDADDGLRELAAAAVAGTGATEGRVVVGRGGALHDDGDGFTETVAIGPSACLELRLPQGEHLRPAERTLLEDLASSARLFMANVELRRSLAARVEEAEHRQAERSEAKRRLSDVMRRTAAELERDLHDGAQARAVSLAALIGLARAGSDGPSGDRLVAEIDAVRSEVVRFARGLHPPELETSGVAGALRVSVPDGLGSFTVADDVGRPCAEFETAMFMMGIEAVQNSVKHAPGSTVEVVIRKDGSLVEIAVSDDGPGFVVEQCRPGRGMTTMRERLEALGGTLSVRSSPGRGTTVVGSLQEPVR